jgi:hypothetical protein
MVKEKSDVPPERDNLSVLKLVRKLKRRPHEAVNYARELCDILEMPASAVGACNSFHNSACLMGVAMREFGIALLMAYDDEDEGVSEKWPYRTPNFLREYGSGVFLPIAFGLIHVAQSGYLSILRKHLPKGKVGA